MKKAEKIFFVENLAAELKSAKSFVLVNFAGLSVKSQQELKRRLKDVGSRLLVVKNTLLKRAGEQASINSEILSDSVLSGQTALIIGEKDPLSPVQVLGKFAKEFDSGAGYSVPQMKVGIIEGRFQDEASLIHLSTLPGRDTLLGQLLGALIAPCYGLVSTLNAGPSMLVSMLERKAKVS